MARGLTALRAALGGVAGGLEGMGAMREERRVLAEREQDRRDRAEALRLAREQAAREEQRDALGAGGMMASMDMPGATPRSNVMRQTIGGQEFMFEPEDVRKRREAIHTSLQAQRKAEQTGSMYEQTGVAPKGMGATYAGLPAEVRQLAVSQYIRSKRGEGDQPSRAAGAAAPEAAAGAPKSWSAATEAIGKKQLEKYGRSPMLAQQMQDIFAENPALAQYPGWVAYQLTKVPANRKLLDDEQKAMGLAAPSRAQAPASGRSAAAPPGRSAAPPPSVTAPARPAPAKPTKKPLSSYYE